VNSEAKKYKIAPLQHRDLMKKLFDGLSATGDFAWSSGMASVPSSTQQSKYVPLPDDMNVDDTQVPLAGVDYPWDGETIPSYDAPISPTRKQKNKPPLKSVLAKRKASFSSSSILMASTSHEEPEAKRSKLTVSNPQKPPLKHTVKLNPADCNLDFDIEPSGIQGQGLVEKGFAYCWSGSRANVGIRGGGKYCFGCKIIRNQEVEMEDVPLDQRHLCRIGVSRGDDMVGNLGETEHSFGFGGTGKFSSGGKFLEYGEKFGVGDTIVCAVNLESKPFGSVGFCKNGKWLGVAKEFDAEAGSKGLGVVNCALRELQWESALFPHILLKNIVVQVQFSVQDGLVPVEGYKPWNCVFGDENVAMGPTFSKVQDCEVLMMVGLPASGKTFWAEKWVKEHPEKRYVLLGTNLALDHMKVPGLLRKHNYGERFDQLMDRATGIFNTLLAKASKTPRNYIIDQTNVYKSARNRKLKPFFRCNKIAVVVFTKPEELAFRAEKRFKEMGKEVSAEVVNEMLANYILPMSKDMHGSDELFDQVTYPELDIREAQRYLKEMKLALQTASNSDSKITVSPYSRESYIYKMRSSFPPDQDALSDTPGYCQNRPSLHQPAGSYPSSQQISSVYTGVGFHGQLGGYQSGSSDSNLSFPKQGLYGDRGGHGTPYSELDFENRNSLTAGSSGLHQGFGRGDPHLRPGKFPSGIIGAHWSHEGVDPYRMPATIRSNFGPTTPFSYTSYDNHLTDPQCVLQLPREARFESSNPSPNFYGSTYATPPPRPSDRNFQEIANHQPWGYSVPGPRYY
ncbi:hypothetical protein GIB67_025177, partial [Kingdonia uniflora]